MLQSPLLEAESLEAEKPNEAGEPSEAGESREVVEVVKQQVTVIQ